jgi:copper(I)-binding protein
MVSRRSIGPLRKILPAIAVGLVALGVAGCGSGQVTQTDSMEPAVNGNKGDVGALALRNVAIAYPDSGAYDKGADAPLLLTIVNTGGTDDELTAVSTPAAGTVEITGDKTLPARTALQAVAPDESAASSVEPTESSAPSSESSGASETSAPGSSESPESSGTESSQPESSQPESTESAEAPDVVGMVYIQLRDLTADLPMGKNVPITFVFANAGQITISVPIDNPGDAREESGGAE